MEPVTTLIALTAAAGFIWRVLTASSEDRRPSADDLDYRSATVVPASKGRAAEFDISTIDELVEYEVVRDLVQERFPQDQAITCAAVGDCQSVTG